MTDLCLLSYFQHRKDVHRRPTLFLVLEWPQRIIKRVVHGSETLHIGAFVLYCVRIVFVSSSNRDI